ncbi:MAG: hybrid sensor histidine kinase/response regulator [Elusimicrobiota bacterium]
MISERILIVDSDKSIISSCKSVLSTEEYSFDISSSGEMALNCLKNNSYDLALVDIELPDMDGLELLSRIKREYSDLNIIVISGQGTIQKAVESMRLGAQDYISKPFSKEELKSIVKRSLEYRRLSSEIYGLQIIKKLYRAIIAISSLMNVDRVLHLILEFACGIVRGDSGTVMMLNERTQELEVKVEFALKGDIIKARNVKVGECVSGWVVEHNEPLLLVGEVKKDPRFKNAALRPEVKSALCVPIKIKDKIVGVINVNTTISPHIFGHTDLELLKLFAEDAGVAIENAQQVYEHLAELNKLKTEFIATVSYELRTPLTVISWTVKNLMDGVFGPLDGVYIKWLNEVNKNSEQLINLINNLLDLSKLEAGKAEIKKINLNINDSIKETINKMAVLAREKDLKVSFEFDKDPLLVYGNKDRLEQVISNILMNAVKFNQIGGEIKIISQLDKGKTRISISDTGVGIDPINLEVIFEKFRQIKKDEFEISRGLGIGLSIAREVITQHQGKIWAENNKDKGSKFIIVLPSVISDKK